MHESLDTRSHRPSSIRNVLSDRTVVAVTVSVVVGTFMAVTLGPAPHLQESASLLSGVEGLSEPTDKAVLILWLAVLCAAIGWHAFLPRHDGRNSSSPSHTARTRVLSVFIVGLLLVTTLVSNIDRTEVANWSPLSVTELFVGLFMSTVVYFAFGRGGAAVRILNVLFLAVSVVYVVLFIWQTPGTVVDFYHFKFTLDEVLAPGAGRIPLGGYVPQYTVLLGFPIAPIAAVFRNAAATIGLLWIVFLQILAICTVLRTLVVNGAHQIAGVLSFVVVAPLVATGRSTGPLIFGSSYFAGFPLRHVLPAILFAFFVGSQSRPHHPTSTQKWNSRRGLLVGLLAGATFLNNPDFGAPAVVAVVVSIILTEGRQALRSRYLRDFLAGIPAVFVAYWMLLRLFGLTVDPAAWIAFPRIFGMAGFGNMAMTRSGLQTVYVTLFIVVAAFSLRVFRAASSHALPRLAGTALFGLVSATWSVLTLTYFVGRSYTSTLMVGHSFQFGIVCASLVSMIYQLRNNEVPGTARAARTGAALLTVAAVATTLVGSGILRTPNIPDALHRLRTPSWSTEQQRQAKWIEERVREITQARVVQMMPSPSLVDLTTSLRSVLILNHPVNFEFSGTFRTDQCKELRRADAEYLVTIAVTARWLRSEPCTRYVQFADKSIPVSGTNLVLLKFVRSPD